MGVEVVVGGGVFDGTDVWVGVSVDKACVTDGVIAANVGVSVPGAFDGKLQADIVRIRVNANNKRLNFIAHSFCWMTIILCRNVEDGNSSSDSNQEPLMCIRGSNILLRFGLLYDWIGR